MGTEKTIGYIYGLGGEPRPDQERFKAPLSALGDPHRAFARCMWRGPTARARPGLPASILAAHGKKTGLYTSPYLERFNERMQIGGAPIGDDELTRAVERVRAAAEAIESAHGAIRPYEAITAAAFWWFARNGVETAVIETGLGGAGDATNVLCPSHVAITSISHDHTRRLGSRIEDIARRRRGSSSAALSWPCIPRRRRWRTCSWVAWGRPAAARISSGRMTWPSSRQHAPPGVRPHMRSFRAVRDRGAAAGAASDGQRGEPACIALDMGVPAEAIRLGIRRVRWPGRMELVCGEQGARS